MSCVRRVRCVLQRYLLLAFSAFSLFSFTSPVAAEPADIVMYAADVTTVRGTWERVSSSTAAGGQLMRSPDAGWRTNTAVASPSSYFEASFDAPANAEYHVWLRMRATNDSTTNDSVMVQFSDALTPAGADVWRIETTSALTVSLEQCQSCAVSGWGWADSSWRLADYPVIKFATTGRHTVRVQAREDGVQVDQIVLSATTYFTGAPGAFKDDATIVPKSPGPVTSAASEVVLYASEASRRVGNWVLESDGTAAFGMRNGSFDYGWDSRRAPSAAPADLLEWTFNAVAGVRYRVWLRMRASDDSFKNDSVWVQFSDSADGGGAPKYRIGTDSGLAVALQDCSGCVVSGWGWQRNSAWLPDTGDVYFTASGTKTLRVQAREDGVAIDQIVLSPSKFVDASPGAVRDDATQVNRDGSVTPIGSVGPGPDPTPSPTYPKTLSFTASTDHETLVSAYRLDVFTVGADPSTATPVRSVDIGKPSPVNGAITVDIGATVGGLASGSYVATVSAVGSAGSSRSAVSNTFSR